MTARTPARTAATATVRWRAQSDGVGHAYPARARGRPACGTTPWDERYDHPVATKCLSCRAATSGEAPGETMELFGK